MLSYLDSKKNLLIFIYFFLFLILGFFIFSDYGISIDEDDTRINGFVSLKYIFEIFLPDYTYLVDNIISIPSMKNWDQQGIGVVFDLPTAFLELLFQIEDSRNFYLMRHLINFLFFYISVYFFYLLIKKRYNSWFFGILGSTFLIASPRIFAESFYNNKDIIFMSLFIICLYTGITFLEKPTIKKAIIFSIITALAIDIRILGIIIPILIILLCIIKILRDVKYKKKTLTPLLIFTTTLPFFIILFWPYLWENPINNFIVIFKKLSVYDYNVYTYYLGEYVSSKNLKWHYPIVWIFISTPVFYSMMFFVGLGFTIKRTTQRLLKIEKNNSYTDLWRSEKELQDLIYLSTFIIPIFMVIILNSTIYDGWRHLYFVYPSFLMISLYGLNLIKIFFFKKRRKLLYFLAIVLIMPTFVWMIKYHPFQNVYFNFLFEKDFNKKFEMDYWGLSNKQALEHIIAYEDKKIYVTSLSTTDLKLSKKIISKDKINKISITYNINEADYIVNNYRDWTGMNKPYRFKIPDNFQVFHEIKVDDVIINTIYKKTIF